MTAVKGDKHPNMIGNKHAEGNDGGRPRSIDLAELEPFGDKMVEWFFNEFKVFENNLEAIKNKKSFILFPTFEKFGRANKVSYATLRSYAGEDKVFSKAWEECKGIQKDFIITAGINGLSHPTFSMFMATNFTDMRVKTETDLTSKGEKITITGMTITNDIGVQDKESETNPS